MRPIAGKCLLLCTWVLLRDGDFSDLLSRRKIKNYPRPDQAVRSVLLVLIGGGRSGDDVGFWIRRIYNVTCERVLWTMRSKVRMRVTCNEDRLKRVLFNSTLCRVYVWSWTRVLEVVQKLPPVRGAFNLWKMTGWGCLGKEGSGEIAWKINRYQTRVLCVRSIFFSFLSLQIYKYCCYTAESFPCVFSDRVQRFHCGNSAFALVTLSIGRLNL